MEGSSDDELCSTTSSSSTGSSCSSSSEDCDDTDEEFHFQTITNITAALTARTLGKRGRRPGPSFRSDDGFLYSQFDVMHEDWFVEEFGLTREQFHVLEEYVVPRIMERERDISQHVLSPRMKMAVLLRYCRKSESVRDLGNRFGVAHQTALDALNQALDVIYFSQEIRKAFIGFPTGCRQSAALDAFHEKTGAIDGTHIPIKAQAGRREVATNRKSFYSLVLQAVVGKCVSYLNQHR